MICPKCKKVIPDDSKICSYCNEPIKGKGKNKKVGCAIVAIVFVVILAIILIVAISSNDSTDTPNSNSSSPSSSESAQQTSDTAKVIYEDKYIKASFIKVYDDKAVSATVEGVSYMQLHIENKSSKTLTIGFSDAAINSKSTTIGSELPLTILPGNSSDQPFILFTKNTGVKSADDISKIQFKFYLMDENTNMVEKTKNITINVK